MTSTEAVNDNLQTGKKQMRARVLATRDAMLPAERASASRVIVGKVWSLSAYVDAKVVLTYLGFGSEIETDAFFERIVADGKIAVLPRVDPATKTIMLHAVHRLSECLTGKWGIREPGPAAPLVSIDAIDFVLLPGVAFDRTGNRLGYGRGYYDRLLSGADPALARIAAAYSCQVVDAVPVGPNDQKVHCVITENEMIKLSHDR